MSSRYTNSNSGSAPPARKGWRTISSARTPSTPTPPPLGSSNAVDDPATVTADFNSKARLTDAEYEAALAQQQSAYGPIVETTNTTTGYGSGGATASSAPVLPIIGVAAAPSAGSRNSGGTISKPAMTNSVIAKSQTSSKPLTVKRSGGGKTWEDSSLLEWDPTHFRLFVGNLSGEVSDEILERAFQAFPSLSKVKVVRDGRTQLTKGYGFVAFKDPEDYFKAFKSMNNKYIGNHPVQLRKATTDVKPTAPPNKRKQGNHGGNRGNNKKFHGKHNQNGLHNNVRYTPYDKLA